jgi:hypothetical protein
VDDCDDARERYYSSKTIHRGYAKPSNPKTIEALVYGIIKAFVKASSSTSCCQPAILDSWP